MKIKIVLCLLAAALLPACTSTKTMTPTASNNDPKAARYADNAAATEVAPPGEGPAEDIPSEGPADVHANPAYVPTPLLRGSAASHP